MGVGGFLGAGEKKIGVRYQALQFSTKDGKRVVSLPQATKEVLAALEPYKRAEAAKSLLERARERVKGSADRAKESDAAAKAKEVGKAAVDKTKELGGKAVEKGKQVIDAAKEKAGGYAAEAVTVGTTIKTLRRATDALGGAVVSGCCALRNCVAGPFSAQMFTGHVGENCSAPLLCRARVLAVGLAW